jgi:hypothetical protein
MGKGAQMKRLTDIASKASVRHGKALATVLASTLLAVGCATQEPRIVERATLEGAGDAHPAVRVTAPAAPSAATGTPPTQKTANEVAPGTIIATTGNPPQRVIYVDQRPCPINSGTFWGALGGGLIGSLFGGGNGRTFFTLLGATAGAIDGTRAGGC